MLIIIEFYKKIIVRNNRKSRIKIKNIEIKILEIIKTIENRIKKESKKCNI